MAYRPCTHGPAHRLSKQSATQPDESTATDKPTPTIQPGHTFLDTGIGLVEGRDHLQILILLVKLQTVLPTTDCTERALHVIISEGERERERGREREGDREREGERGRVREGEGEREGGRERESV